MKSSRASLILALLCAALAACKEKEEIKVYRLAKGSDPAPAADPHAGVPGVGTAELPDGHPPIPTDLPDGHPPIPSDLPDGHPPIPSDLPEGHPPIPSDLPEGHPPIPSDLPEGHPPVAPDDVPATPPGAGTIKWDIQAGWVEAPAKPMRLVTFVVKAPGGESGEVTVVKLGGDTGGTLANVNRWRMQIGLEPLEGNLPDPLTEKVRIGELDHEKVELNGPRGGLIVAWHVRGNERWFFKLAGPAAVVDAQKPSFDAFLESIRFVEE
jgi:hypothetical protein